MSGTASCCTGVGSNQPSSSTAQMSSAEAQAYREGVQGTRRRLPDGSMGKGFGGGKGGKGFGGKGLARGWGGGFGGGFGGRGRGRMQLW